MSRIAIISDVHANLPALEAICKEMDKESPDEWICLGDIVGYGPHPGDCIEIIRDKKMMCVLGNHDAGVAGKLTLKHFRNPNRRLIELTRGLISQDQLQWLSDLPYRKSSGSEWVAAHASPVKPEHWEYLESAFTIRSILKNLDYEFCLVGHTHKPVLVSDGFGPVKLVRGHKYLINPGSVGQSRDGDFRASGAILDTEKYELKNIRTEFNLVKVLDDLRLLGFSQKEAEHMMRVS